MPSNNSESGKKVEVLGGFPLVYVGAPSKKHLYIFQLPLSVFKGLSNIYAGYCYSMSNMISDCYNAYMNNNLNYTYLQIYIYNNIHLKYGTHRAYYMV